MIAEQRMAHDTFFGHVASRAPGVADGTNRGFFPGCRIVTILTGRIIAPGFVSNIDVRVMTGRAFQLAETLVKATAQDNSLTRESDSVRRILKQPQCVEIVVLGRRAVAGAAHLYLRKPLHPAGMKDVFPRRLAVTNGHDVLGPWAVAALAAHTHLVAGRCLAHSIVARCMTAKALGDLLLGQLSSQTLARGLGVAFGSAGREIDTLEAGVPGQPAFDQLAVIGAGDGRDALYTAAESLFKYGQTLI